MNSFKITSSKDKQEAYIEVVDENDDSAINTLDDLMTHLNELGIIAGLKADVMKAAFSAEPETLTEPVVIAAGQLAGEPQSARFDFEIDMSSEPQFVPDEDESTIDYKEAMKIELVESGTLLGEYYPALRGKSGYDIYGTEIPSAMGETFTVVEGDGVRKEGNKFYATKIGKPSFNLGVLEVKELLEIDGDINYETGNINFPGSVFIKGSVLDGFKVSCGGDLEVMGIIGDCEIDVGGTLRSRSGIIAKENSHKVRAVGGMELSFCNFAQLECQGDIMVTKNLLHTVTHCLGVVSVQKGSIIGGDTIAANGVEASEIGSETGVITRVFIRINYEAVLLHQLLDKILESADTIYQRNRGYLASGLIHKKGFDQVKQDLTDLDNLHSKSTKIQEQILAREKLVEDLEGVCVRTHKRVWPDVIFKAPGCTLIVNEGIDGAKVFVDDTEMSTLLVHQG